MTHDHNIQDRNHNKYIVIKNADIDEAITNGFLDRFDLQVLEQILGKISEGRKFLKKKPFNHYVVVNEDTLYADIVWKLIEIFGDLKS